MSLQIEYGHLVDLADVVAFAPTDIEIVDALVEAFDLPAITVIERLSFVDVPAVRREVAP